MKKFLALLLALTTAVSMFAGSVSAINFDDEVAFTGKYTPAEVEFSDGKITVTQDYFTGDIAAPYVNTNVVEITGGVDFYAFVEHIVIGEPDGAPYDYNAYVAMNPGLMTDKYGYIYMYDYLKDSSAIGESALQSRMNIFADLVSKILSTPRKDIGSFDGDDIDEFAKAWSDAYTTSYSTQDTAVRYDAMTQARANMRAIQDKVDASGSLKSGIYDTEDVYDYNADALFNHVYNYDKATFTTSELVYLNSEYERVTSSISYADQTYIMGTYYDKLDKVTSYVEENFTAAGWREVQEYLEEAEEIAAEANSVYDWQNAIDALDRAIAVRGKAVDYTDLQDALASLFVGEGKASDIRSDVYLGDNDSVYVYLAKDFMERYTASQEWKNFAGNASGLVDGRYAAYTVAYRLWKSARSNATSVKQSELDNALQNLNITLEALLATYDKEIPKWLIVKLEEAVKLCDDLVESDFNTTTRKWEKFQDDIAKAEEVLAKSNPYEAEVIRVTNKLAASEGNGSYYDIRATAKAVPANMKEELRELIITGDSLYANITTQAGEVAAALREATADADEVYALVDRTDYKRATISEVDEVIRNLKIAIKNFNLIVPSETENTALTFNRKYALKSKLLKMTFTQPETVVASSLGFKIEFDNKTFEIVEIAEAPYSSLQPSLEGSNNKGNIGITWTDPTYDANTEIPAGTVLLEVTFKVRDTATLGTKSFRVLDYNVTGKFDDETYAPEDITPDTGSLIKTIELMDKPDFTLSGTVRSFGNSTDDITIELIDSDEVIATKILTDGNNTFTFEDVTEDVYKVRAFKSKHCARVYDVAVDDDITKDLEIWLYGDVNGDGTVNNIDVLQMTRYIVNLSSVFDSPVNTDYRIDLANITGITAGDTVLNNMDVLQIERHIVNLTSILDTIA